MNRFLDYFRYSSNRPATRPPGGKYAWRLRFRDLAIIAGLLITVPIYAISAPSGANVVGTLDASAQSPVPPDAAIGVQSPSGAPEAQAIAALFRAALENAGYQPSEDGGYVLRFQISGDSPDGGGRSAFELRGDRGSRSSGDVELKMRWKMKRGEAAPMRRGRRLLVSMVKGAQNQVWQARVEIQANDADDLTVVEALIPALMANLGRTVYALRVP